MAAFRSTSQASALSHLHAASDVCPLCEQAIPNDKQAAVQERARARERQREAEDQARMQAAVETALTSATARMTSDFAAREAKVRDEVRLAAEHAMTAKIADARSAQVAAEKRAADIAAAQEDMIAVRLREQRDLAEAAKSDAVNAERIKQFEKNLKLESMVEDLQRKLQNKTVDELGDGAEVDLFEVLRGEFPGDDIARVGRGKPGADIVHKVRHNGVACGTILYDSKNHQQWRNDHASKLRADQIEASADHAVLSTKAFPKDQRELHIESGVIIVKPGRAAVMAMILRRHIVQMHTLRVSNEARSNKIDELYTLMTSDRFEQFMSAMRRATEQLEALQAQERKAHDQTWKKQGELFNTLMRSCAQFDNEIARIIGTANSDM